MNKKISQISLYKIMTFCNFPGLPQLSHALVCPLRERSPSLDIAIGDARHDKEALNLKN